MKQFAHIFILAFGLCFGCSKNNVLSPAQFSREFAEALRQASPGLKVDIVSATELQITKTNGSHDSVFLGNAYDLYSHDPKSKDEIIQKYVAVDLESLVNANFSEEIDRTRIVPVVKDKLWLEDFQKEVANRGGKNVPDAVSEEINSDLIIVYAEDSPNSIRYLFNKDLEKSRIDRNELRALACENLKRMLPKIERYGTNGAYMLTVGGDYEASLLLLDSVWTGIQKDVSGDIVVAIPSRDVLLVTGSDDRDGLEKMRQTINKISAQSAYRLTKKLFVRRDGKFVEFTGDSK